jgi:Lrp/AsnC family leucine-responsive transcriptional regulator
LCRVRALEEDGVIRRYAALVSPSAIGLEVTAFVSLTLGRDQFRNVREVERNVMAFPEIVECHIISGGFDYLLKVVATDLKSLSQFLTDRLMQVPGVSGVHSMICLEEIKSQGSLPT